MSLSPFWVDARERASLHGPGYRYWSNVRSSGNDEVVYTSETYTTEQAMMKTARKMSASLGCALCNPDGEWETP